MDGRERVTAHLRVDVAAREIVNDDHVVPLQRLVQQGVAPRGEGKDEEVKSRTVFEGL